MKEGSIARKSDLEVEAHAALSELKDWIILLDMAGDYLCAALFLRKMASTIDGACEVLKNWSEELKERFVGKPLHEIDMDEPFQRIKLFSQELLEAEEKTEHLCREGKVARQLDEKLRLLKERLAELKDRVEGEAASYTVKDSLARLFGKLKFVIRGFVTTYKVATRIIAVLFMVGLFSFLSLFMTMEKDADVLKEIHRTQDVIQSKEAELAGIKDKIEKIRIRTSEMESSTVTRDEKISILELNLRSHKLVDAKEKIQAELHQQQKVLDKNTQKLERMRRKSFIARLLRM